MILRLSAVGHETLPVGSDLSKESLLFVVGDVQCSCVCVTSSNHHSVSSGAGSGDAVGADG